MKKLIEKEEERENQKADYLMLVQKEPKDLTKEEWARLNSYLGDSLLVDELLEEAED